METAATPATTKWYLKFGALRWGSLTLLVILVDQMTKAFVESRFDLFDAVRVLPFLEFTLLYNTGAAFSFLADASGWQRWFFIALGVVVSVAILLWLRQLDPRRHRLLAAGLALIMGGALGNVIDRVWHGHVIDFIHFHWKQWEFPAFNMADTSITIGAALLILDAILEGRRARSAVTTR
ncbi:MAG TPA: signal peptidase II [Steroidobacteraceae bacterium]|nr:signal peptidase II [Steroidobacteraceae bacterium]